MNSKKTKNIFEIALRDLEKLLFEETIYAGLPHFFCLFGRDSIITSLQLLSYNPGVAKNTLRTLAKLQGRKFDPVTEEEPGKILHELRKGEEAIRFPWPFPYFGTIDATPLYLVLLGKYYRKTGDLALVKELWENALWALNWLEYCGDLDNDYFVEYERKNLNGLKNQGWKDSHDSIHYLDGALVEPPIALVEVQGYTYQALVEMHYLATELKLEWAFLLKKRAETLKARFNKAFWMEEEKYYALGLDENKEQIKTITSNPGHLLFSKVVSKERAEFVVERLMGSELFSGWGIRTLSLESRRYDPFSYHNGSVWFHDNWIILEGMENYGFYQEAEKVKTALVEAATYLNFIPELFSGEPRGKGTYPRVYKDACYTQAWSAGAIISIFTKKTNTNLKPALINPSNLESPRLYK